MNMKTKFWILIVICAAAILAACGGGAEEIWDGDAYVNGYTYFDEDEAEEDNEGEEESEEEVAVESVLDFAQAARFFAAAQAIWDEDGGDLWGAPLHVPLVFACNLTRDGVTNRPFGDFVRQTPNMGWCMRVCCPVIFL